MIRVKSILVPTDFSETSASALLASHELAQRFDAKLHVLHILLLEDYAPVYPVVAFPDAEKVRERLRSRAKEGLQEFVANYSSETVTSEQALREGMATAPAILDYAEEGSFDLIVMGTHGRRGLRRLVLGSVTEEVLRQANCPVLTVPPAPEDRPSAAPSRILAPADFSKHAHQALLHAREISALYKASVDLLHVIPEPSFPVFYEFANSPEVYYRSAELKESSAAELQKLAEETGPWHDIRCHVTSGIPEEVILGYAEDHGTDLIVLATHGLSGLSHLLMGSVTEKVVRRAPCPVFTLHSFGKSLVERSAA